MQAIWLVVLVLAVFSVAYVAYGRYLAQFVELDDANETPAHKYEDGQEYVPSKKPVLLGHHYSSIAGGAPIVGPITAGVWWGWIPAFLWIAIGNPLMGSVHDFVSLSSSVRHEGKSIGYIIGQYVGDRGKDMLLWFAFLTIILVVAVFAFVIAYVFKAYPSSATASLIYIGLALLFGIYLYQLDLPLIPGTVAFVALVFAGVWVGTQYPIALSQNTWIPIIIVYAFVASVLPVWTLLQPRDYLSSFLLYTGVGGTLLAVIVGTFLVADPQTLAIKIHAWNGFMAGSYAKPLFPLLFVTIACGTISGFHSLVSSGTTAKQLNKESDARTIGYGGMLGEGLLATVSLVTLGVAGITTGTSAADALANFATGGGIILSTVGIPRTFGGTFMALVMVSFLLTSTDTALRLGRYMLEEIVGTPESSVEEYATNKYVNAGIQSVVAYLLVSSGTWGMLWPLFGSANQLLAALALLTGTVWLANWDESKQLLSTGGPMALMFAITLSALVYLQVYINLWGKLIQPIVFGTGSLPGSPVSIAVQVVIGLVLIYLAVSLLVMGYRNISSARETAGVATDGGTTED
ncbi:MAG: carbon starvation protein A [Halanaeroarchaeum sp.]